MPPLGAFGDPDGHGFALSSLNPNLRVAGSNVAEALVSASPQVPPQKVQAFTFFVSMGASYLQVARYQGRSFPPRRLPPRGRVPAVVIDAPSFHFITSTPGLFDHEVAFSDRAPTLADFWDDSVSADALQPAGRKVVRIKAEQFVIQG